MVANRKVSGKAMSVPAGVSIGAGVSVLVSVIGATVLAWLVEKESLPELGMGYGAMCVLTVASVLGPWIAAVLVKHQRLAVCAGTGGVYLALLMIVNAVGFGGQIHGFVPTVLLVLGGSIAAALLGNVRTGDRTSRHHKCRYG